MTASEASRTRKQVNTLCQTGGAVKPNGSLDDRARLVIEKLKLSIVKYNIDLLSLFTKVRDQFSLVRQIGKQRAGPGRDGKVAEANRCYCDRRGVPIDFQLFRQ